MKHRGYKGQGRVPPLKRFFSKVDLSRGKDGCWLWIAGTTRHGYGAFSADGHDYAHRFILGVLGHDIAGKDVCHRCDTPRCVNPAHLFVGTARDNLRDMAAKGRAMRGGGHVFAVLTESDVVAMRADRRAGMQYTEIATKYGVHKVTARDACTGTTWDHVPGALPRQQRARRAA